MRVIGVAVVALVASGAVHAAATVSMETEPASSKDRVICKTSKVTGSRLRKARTCRTEREWSDLTRQVRETLRGAQRTGPKPQ